ncbi:DUF1579 domain-containing protein [Stigmatella aurantiaca]|uniref:Conserved uncharacterized protein n=1 Tax=Stigmatella aurantiaca (strain DW4/3-1) TaxID=378806 RepID=Q092B8_STIAD|nr:DUF1579 domain-containing protein [Stigmatella aurantiaca]ADO75734.1 conserved uncharacterized protein [Stigmatella aurantiaca DW4/3-1]EAU66567.1 conserved hypothetical protein [Stigmatella aurantiaca DW4/3-1]
MSPRSFQESLSEGGIHHRLSQLAGQWEGVTKTWFEPDKLADESPWRGTIRPVAGGRLVVHEYEGAIQGKPLSGMVLYAYHLDLDRYEVAWFDTFHTGTSLMFFTGAPVGQGLGVLGSYGPPSGPPWGWRTEIHQPAADQLIITHYNIPPEGQGAEAKAVETVYRRVPGR